MSLKVITCFTGSLSDAIRFRPQLLRKLSTAVTTRAKIKTNSQDLSKSDTDVNIARVQKPVETLCSCDNPNLLHVCSKSAKCQYRVDQVPVYIKTHGCQMNVNDTAILSSILVDYGYKIVSQEEDAEICLLMTCAIRESAEFKVWSRLRMWRRLKEDQRHPLKQIGLLGCMAERLKEKVLQTPLGGMVDIIAGPDAYRDLPRLFAINKMNKEKAVNCLLSFDETYSDIRPVTNLNTISSFVSITRGCDNLCSFCIVPFTRGKERSRPLPTIVDEIRSLVDKGFKEVTLLGQNVNSYRDLLTQPELINRPDLLESMSEKGSPAQGFKTVYKPRIKGLNFAVLLEEVAKISPELRIRFTSPHPKDFTDDVIEVMSKYPNIARCIHLPAQSGSDEVLKNMRRGYTKEAYLNLVKHLKTSLPGLALTGDFIAGFCGETELDHLESLDLIRKVEYNFLYIFPYSMRDKTHAFHNLNDDVPEEEKRRRHFELVQLFREIGLQVISKMIGTKQLLLVESTSRRSDRDWVGRVATNTKTHIPKMDVLDMTSSGSERQIKVGDYVACRITGATSQTCTAMPLYITSQESYFQLHQK